MYLNSPFPPWSGVAGYSGGVLRGLGQTPLTSAQIASMASGSAAGIAAALRPAADAGQIVAGAGGAIFSLAPLTGPAAPFVMIGAAAVEVAGTVMHFLGVGDGCGAACVQTSNWANQVEQQLQANIAAYFSGPRTQTSQAVAVAVFDGLWGQLDRACSGPDLGSAGVACISDRKAGSCKWRQTADKLPPWGVPPVGACWNWFSGYRDPIANDPNVQPDPIIPGVTTSGGFTLPALGSISPLVLGGVALLVVVLVVMS